MTTALKLHGRDALTGGAVEVCIEGERIASVEPCSEDLCGADDVSYLGAGLVDLQVNGYAGIDLNAAGVTPEEVSALARKLLATGVTSFVPTLITDAKESLVQRLAAIAEARQTDALAAACIPMVHMEGPSISEVDGYRGAHARQWVRPPSTEEFERWQEVSGGLVGMVTMSPHFADSVEYIRSLVKREVLVSLGHTHASHMEITAAVSAGARLSTHLGNGIATELARHPNPIWSQLAEDSLVAMFIADGHHLPAETLRAMLAAKGVERSLLVSDLVSLAGMPPGMYDTPVGGVVELRADGRLALRRTGLLAGATAPLLDCLGRAVAMTGRPLRELYAMVTSTPGKYAGGRGLMRAGARADLLRFAWDAEQSHATVLEVWLAGERVHPASACGGAPCERSLLPADA